MKQTEEQAHNNISDQAISKLEASIGNENMAQNVITTCGLQVVLPSGVPLKCHRLKHKDRKEVRRLHNKFLMIIQDMALPDYIIDSYPGKCFKKIYIGHEQGKEEEAREFLKSICNEANFDEDLFELEPRTAHVFSWM